MTQKELSYVEDAIGHECCLIKVCEFSIQNFNDKNLSKFMNEELKKHKNIKKRLIKLLEDNLDE